MFLCWIKTELFSQVTRRFTDSFLHLDRLCCVRPRCCPSFHSMWSRRVILTELLSLFCPTESDRRPSLYEEGVVLQETQQRLGKGQLVGAVCVFVDGEPRQVLQRRKALRAVQRFHQFQGDSTVFICLLGGVWLRLGLHRRQVLRRLAWDCVVLDEAQNVWESLELRQVRRSGVQPEAALLVLYTHAGRSTAGLHRQGQHVLRMAAVPHQERALRLGEESFSSFTGRDRPPVPT